MVQYSARVWAQVAFSLCQDHVLSPTQLWPAAEDRITIRAIGAVPRRVRAGRRSVSSNLAAASPLARNHRFVPARARGERARPGPFSRK